MPRDETGFSAEAEATSGQTILVVDDEPAVRMVIVELLRRQGYRVLSCATGREAMEIFEAGVEPVDLVIVDLSLPDVPGDQLVVDLRRSRPDARVIASSGYPAAGDGTAGYHGAAGYLKKPFDAVTLGQAVGAALNA